MQRDSAPPEGSAGEAGPCLLRILMVPASLGYGSTPSSLPLSDQSVWELLWSASSPSSTLLQRHRDCISACLDSGRECPNITASDSIISANLNISQTFRAVAWPSIIPYTRMCRSFSTTMSSFPLCLFETAKDDLEHF